jgi:hypothetical protein
MSSSITLNIHKPQHDRWRARHPNVHFHFTPTHTRWLNQIECWFSILTRRVLRSTGFTSPQEVREAIDRFIATYNPQAVPFEWTKREIGNVHPKPYYANHQGGMPCLDLIAIRRSAPAVR